MPNPNPPPNKDQHLTHLKSALDLARLSPPKPSNFRVGCVIVSYLADSEAQILSTGYTLELPGNTHAEENALSKLATEQQTDIPKFTAEQNIHLYTTLEPCAKRLSGNKTCVERILETGSIQKVIFGAKEPKTFVGQSQACKTLTEAGVSWEFVEGLEEEILQVAMAGHASSNEQTQVEEDKKVKDENADANQSGQSVEDRKTKEPVVARNPKKRMMEVDIGRPDPSSSQS